MSPNLRGALLALAAFGVFSSHDVFIKILGGLYSPIQIVFFSVLFSFPLAALMLMRDSTAGTLIPRYPGWMGLRTLAVVCTGFSAFYAFSILPLAEVYAILFATPLFVTILAIPVLGETIGLRRGAAILVGLAGVMVVLAPSGDTQFSLGHLAALVAAVGGAIASVVVRRVGPHERPVVLLLYPMMANFLLMGALLVLVYKEMPIQHLGMLAIIAALAFAASRLIVSAYSSGEAAIVAPMQYSQIVWASLFGALFFNEFPQMNTVIGAGIVIASGLYIVLRESRSDASETTPVLRTRSRIETGTFPRIANPERDGGGDEDGNPVPPEPTLPKGDLRPHLRGIAGRTPARFGDRRE